MKYLQLIITFTISISCSQKITEVKTQNKLSSGLDQISSFNKMNGNKNALVYADRQNLYLLLKKKKAAFIIFGIKTDDFSAFEKKYGIKVKTENCVISQRIAKFAAENNKTISNYLSQKFPNNWKSDLKIIPFGLN